MQPLASSGDCLQQHFPFGLLAQWEGKVSDWDPFLRMFAYIHPRTNLRVWAQALAKSSDHSRPKMMEEVCDPHESSLLQGFTHSQQQSHHTQPFARGASRQPIAPPPHRTLVSFLALCLIGLARGAQSVGAQIHTLAPSTRGSNGEYVHKEEPGLDSAR